MKIFFLLVAIGLFTSTLTGIYMSYRFIHNKLVVTALLLRTSSSPSSSCPFNPHKSGAPCFATHLRPKRGYHRLRATLYSI